MPNAVVDITITEIHKGTELTVSICHKQWGELNLVGGPAMVTVTPKGSYQPVQVKARLVMKDISYVSQGLADKLGLKVGDVLSIIAPTR